MSIHHLNEKKVRALRGLTGQDLLAVCAFGHPVYALAVTEDHRHILVNRRTGEWEVEEEYFHWASCRKWFPGAAL